MPRTRQQQPARAAAEQAYGVKNEQLEAQQQMPLPQADQGLARPPTSAEAMGPNLLEAAAAYDPQVTPLGAPTQRPGEPLTAGLPYGPGPGPEAINPMLISQRRHAALDKLQALADMTGDPWLASVVARAQGGSGA